MTVKRLVLTMFIFSMIFLGKSPACLAITQGVYELGALVPFARYDTAEGVDTVVGIAIDQVDVGKGIYWSFHSADGTRLAGGFMGVRENTFDYSFSLAGKAGGAGEKTSGYLVLVWNNDSTLEPSEGSAADQNLTANSFLVDLAFSDAAFLPVIPLRRSDFASGTINLLQMNAQSLVDLYYGVSLEAAGVSARYLVNPATDDAVTTLLLFFPSGAPENLNSIFFTTSGDLPQSSSILVGSAANKLLVIDVGSIAPDGFTEGSIFIENPIDSPLGLGFVLAFSLDVGAEQTLMGVESR